jgi:hypothetical protein
MPPTTNDARYRSVFAGRFRVLYPGCPEPEATAIAEHACARYSGRVGRTADAKRFDPETIALAVRAHIRHVHTEYDLLLIRGWARQDARDRVRPQVDTVVDSWSRERS